MNELVSIYWIDDKLDQIEPVIDRFDHFLSLRNPANKISRFADSEDFCDSLLTKKISKPDAIITDILMPKLNGIDLAIRIRGAKEFDDCILISSSILGEAIDNKYRMVVGFDASLPDLSQDTESQVNFILKLIKAKSEVIKKRYSYDNFHHLLKELYLSRMNVRSLEENYIKRLIDPNVYIDLKADQPDGLIWRRKECSVGFVDIRGYTELSARLEPEDLAILLNTYVKVASQIIINEKGAIDKFIGDAIMWTVGAITDVENHQLKNIFIARKILGCLPEINTEVSARIGRTIRIACGIGLSCGPVEIGLLGYGGVRMQHTVIGSYVNLAARLAAKAKGGQILVGGRMDSNFEKEGVLTYIRAEKVKGFIDKLRIFKVESL